MVKGGRLSLHTVDRDDLPRCVIRFSSPTPCYLTPTLPMFPEVDIERSRQQDQMKIAPQVRGLGEYPPFSFSIISKRQHEKKPRKYWFTVIVSWQICHQEYGIGCTEK